jgi:hypothetical protein
MTGAALDDADDKLSGNFVGKESSMIDEWVGKLARVLVDHSIEGGEGDQVLVCDLREGGELYADGELIQENGRFLEFDLAGVSYAG